MAELRQRTSSVVATATDGAKALSSSVSKEKAKHQAAIAAALEGKLGKGTADAVAPIVAMGLALFKVFAPFIVQGWNFAKATYETLPTDVVMCIFGLALCLFGGVFQASIAAVEAFKLCGWNKTKGYIRDIYEQVQKVVAHQGTGAKGKEMSTMAADKLLAYEFDLVLTHVDPAVVKAAWTGLFGAVMGVIATLQSQFAKTVALGTAIANAFSQTGEKHIVPVLAHMMEEKVIACSYARACIPRALPQHLFISRLLSCICTHALVFVLNYAAPSMDPRHRRHHRQVYRGLHRVVPAAHHQCRALGRAGSLHPRALWHQGCQEPWLTAGL